jgi:AraC-like DNA-binding protein
MNQTARTTLPSPLSSSRAETGGSPALNGYDVRSAFPAGSEGAGPEQARALERIKPSVEYIFQHLDQPMSVAMLSKLVGLAESTFFALFKRATGRAPIEFVIRARMRIAGEMLRSSDLHIKQIAAALGYPDQFYFSRLFKSVHGVAPSNHRSGHREYPNGSFNGQNPAATELPPEREDLDCYRRIGPSPRPQFPAAVAGQESRLNMRR